MLRYRFGSRSTFIGAVALAVALGGCSNQAQVSDTGSWFSKPVGIFAKPDWARPADANTADLGPKGPVSPNELVNADGSCAPAETPQAATPESEPATTASTDPQGGLQTGIGPGGPPVLGGIALGMTECDAVRRAGQPSNVSIGAAEKGERKVVLTYLSGTWPGIYTFESGRLKVIERAPEPEKPKAAPKKKPAKRAKTASGPEHAHVQ